MPAGRLLVVAPAKEFRDSLVFALEAEGYSVTAVNGLTPASWLATRSFDCTVLHHRALTGSPDDILAFTTAMQPIVLLTSKPHGFLDGLVSRVVEMPVAGDAVAAAVREAIHAKEAVAAGPGSTPARTSP
jgi:CheY-like chemotaxis protein